MAVLKLKEDKPKNTVFRLPVDTSTGPNGLLRNEYLKDQASLLYPLVSNTPKEEVDTFLNSGIIGPLQAKTEALTTEKKVSDYTQIIETARLDQKTPEQAIAELEALRESNPLLKAYVSPEVLGALKQSDNPTAKRFAQGKLSNVLIASEVLNNKLSEASAESFWTNFDFVDMLASDLPIVSSINVQRRKALSDRFLQLMDSSEDPAIVKKEMQDIVNEAADMGFFTDSNRFYINDFLNLTLEQGKGAELALQQTLGGLDAIAFLPALGDTGKLIAATRKSVPETSDALLAGVMKDSPTGAVDPATWKESIITSERTTPRSPTEAAAVKDVELAIQARQEAIAVRQASGSFIDDDTFEPFVAALKDAAVKRAEKAGNLRHIDTATVVRKDDFDNIQMDEFFGTTKGRAFTSPIAAQKYADQVLGEVVPIADGGFMVKKTSNVPTNWYSQGATPNAIVDDLALFPALDLDDMGKGFWAEFGSGLSQTDWTTNAILKQSESSRALALEIVKTDLAAQFKIIGKNGKNAIEKVFTEMRDGSLANLRKPPTTAEFGDYFFKVNARSATPEELRAYEILQDWNDTDWFLSADMHFKREVNRGIEILVPQDGLEVAASKTSKEAMAGREVWDVDSGKYVSVDSLPDDRIMYRLVEPMEFDGKLHDLVASAVPKTRALKHSDVMGYNVGGSRLYANNRTNFMIKQETEYTLADGVKRKGTPRTIMAVKTEKEAAKAVSEINEVISKLHSIVDPKAFTKLDDYLAAIKTKYNNSDLQDTIARNSGWNTDVHSLEALVEFAAENNFDLRKLVDSVSDGQPLVKGDDMIGDITFKDVSVAPGLLKYGDFRKDKVLMGYGGQKVPTIGPMESMNRSLMSAMARQTEVAYETRSILRLYKTALMNNLVPRENIAMIRNMSLRQKAKNMIIDTGSDAGKKLELERRKILSRLEKQRVLDNAYHKAKDAFANILYDAGFKKIANKMDALSADPAAANRGMVFDVFFWGAIDQAWVQGSQLFSIGAIADKAMGIQAAAAAPMFRAILKNGHVKVDEAAAKMLAVPMGIEPKQVLDMLEGFRTSGRGAVQASVADLGEDAGGKIMFQKARETGRIFYNEGELLSRITAHIAASMEYIAKNGPKADLKSQHGKRWVMHESDKLTHAMTSTSRHPIEQLPMMQFMSYSLRMTEYLFSGLLGGKGVLTPKQKIKLATTQLGFFGATAVPFGGAMMAWYEYKYGTGLDERTYDMLRKGALDALLEYVTGVETEVGGRIAWGEGMFNTITDLQDKNLVQILLGPTGTVAKNIMEATNQLLGNIKFGSMRTTSEDLLDVAKVMKFANMYHNAYLAFRYGTYQSRVSGDLMVKDMDFGEAMAVALGVPLEKVNKVWDEIQVRKTDEEYYKATGKKISRLFNDLHMEVEKNGWGTAHGDTISKSIETLYALHSSELYKINRYVDKKFITMYEQTVINQAKRDAEKAAMEGNQ